MVFVAIIPHISDSRDNGPICVTLMKAIILITYNLWQSERHSKLFGSPHSYTLLSFSNNLLHITIDEYEL